MKLTHIHSGVCLVGACHSTRWHARAKRMGDTARSHAGSTKLILEHSWRPRDAFVPWWLLFFYPHFHAIGLGVGEQVGVLSKVGSGRAFLPRHPLHLPSVCTGVPREGALAAVSERGCQRVARIPCLIMGQAYVATLNDFSATRSFFFLTRRP
jgi:hypothetical protein